MKGSSHRGSSSSIPPSDRPLVDPRFAFRFDLIHERLRPLARYASKVMGPNESIIMVAHPPEVAVGDHAIAFEDVPQIIKREELGNQVIAVFMRYFNCFITLIYLK